MCSIGLGKHLHYYISLKFCVACLDNDFNKQPNILSQLNNTNMLILIEDYIDCHNVIKSMIHCYSHGSVMSPWKIPLLGFFKSLCSRKDTNWYVLHTELKSNNLKKPSPVKNKSLC